MWQVLRFLAWRSNQPLLVRWLEAFALFAAAFVVRYALGWPAGAIPFLTFYPAILIAALLLGWQEAVFVLLLSIAAGLYIFLPPDMIFLPIGWALAGTFNIAIIIALKALGAGPCRGKRAAANFVSGTPASRGEHAAIHDCEIAYPQTNLAD